MRILFAEDEIKINTIIEESLKKEGYTVDAVMDGRDAISYFNLHNYDIVILDLMMPEVSGEEVLKYIRTKNKSIPVIALTAKSDTSSIVSGLDKGFDDYITKPFKSEELKARIRTLLRRTTTKETLLYAYEVTLNPVSKTANIKDKVIPLTSKEFSILEFLLRHKNSYKNESEIFDNIWDHGSEIESNVIAAHIKNIKKKIESINPSVNIIESERGKGYIIKG